MILQFLYQGKITLNKKITFLFAKHYQFNDEYLYRLVSLQTGTRISFSTNLAKSEMKLRFYITVIVNKIFNFFSYLSLL